MAIAIIAHHLETHSGNWAKVKALLISTYHVEEEEPNLNDILDNLLAQGLDINKLDMFLNSFANITASLHNHFHCQCSLLDKDLKNGRIHLINGKVATTNGTILQTNRGQGGIHTLMLKYEDQTAQVNLISCSSTREQAQHAVLRLTTDIYDNNDDSDPEERTYEVAAQKCHHLDAPPEVVPARKVIRTVKPESIPRTAMTPSQPRHNGPTINHDNEPEVPKNKPQYQYMALIQEGVDTNSVITQ
ncbi:hypothetical protein EV182_002258 [Spiromyces aspiralis]|uniref:Uncharacterized protein n=1 Tax=Spiromyces aspiralis TaxID=68401 RepID=A0ACC1HI90_9FUNG|nr:hypothetical protein EV182_002258 [Spiromyces aspiralis]